MSLHGDYGSYGPFGRMSGHSNNTGFHNRPLSPHEQREARDFRMHEQILRMAEMAKSPFRALFQGFRHADRMHGHHGLEHRNHGHEGHRDFARNESIFQHGFRHPQGPEQRFC